ncbi:MAG: hypothetical protein MI919_15930 [Holophagales bacterium]|nr:hypothetical protein [Holophagales bacterium]
MGDVLHGRIALPQTRYHDSHEVKEKVVQAVMLLDNPRHREFIYFDLILLLPKEEIISRLGIAPGYFAKLKHKAMKDLRAAIIKVMTR